MSVILVPPRASTCVFKSIMVSNDSASEDTITLTITDSASAVFSLYKNESIGALSTEELLKAPLVLSESEVLTATAATIDRLHVVASYLEIS